MAISDCVNGNTKVTERYLSTSPEKDLFLTGRSESGDTTLIMAAIEKSQLDAVVELCDCLLLACLAGRICQGENAALMDFSRSPIA
jgi:hypothetical protein